MRIFLLRYTGTHIKPTYTPHPTQRNPSHTNRIYHSHYVESVLKSWQVWWKWEFTYFCIISELFANVPPESSESHQHLPDIPPGQGGYLGWGYQGGWYGGVGISGWVGGGGPTWGYGGITITTIALTWVVWELVAEDEDSCSFFNADALQVHRAGDFVNQDDNYY